jgi:hypothetical protein
MYIRRGDREPVAVTPEGQFIDGTLNIVPESELLEVCDVCEEEGSEHDPLAHFKHPDRFGEYTIAHGQCGIDFDLELA